MIVAGLLVAGMAMAQQAEIDRYNVEWDTPSENSAGSMPLGNGELGANLWVVYFDSRFRNGQGKIHITPTQSVETYWYGVENDMPSVAGLHYVLGALEKLPSHLLPEPDRQYYLQLKKDLPDCLRSGLLREMFSFRQKYFWSFARMWKIRNCMRSFRSVWQTSRMSCVRRGSVRSDTGILTAGMAGDRTDRKLQFWDW